MTDSWLDRMVHRRLSRPLSAVAVKAGVAPNLVTLASLAVGLGGAWCVARATAGGAALGVALYLVAVVLDHTDGEVARRTGTQSRLGHWLDIAADTAVHAALVLAMGAAAGRLGAGRAVGLGVLAAVGVVASAAVAQAWPLDRAPGRPAPRLARLLEDLGNRHGFYALLLAFSFCVASAPGLLPGLLVVVAIGSHAYWMGRVFVGFAGRAPRAAGRGRSASREDSAPSREPIVRGGLCALLAAGLLGLACLAQAAGESGGGPGVPKLPEPLTREAIRELVARLSDAEVRQLLLAQLDRAAAPARETPGNVMDMVSDMDSLGTRAVELVRAAGTLPGVFADAVRRLIEGRGPGHLAVIAVGLVVMFAAGLGAERLFRHLIRSVQRALEEGPADGLVAQGGRLVLRLALELVALSVFVAGALSVFFAVYQGHAPTRKLVLAAVTAVVLVRMVALVSRLVLAPGAPALRLLPFEDDAAWTLHRGLVRLGVLYGATAAVVEVLRGLEAPQPALDVINLTVGVLFLAFAFDTIWRLRAGVAAMIRGAGDGGPLRRLLAELWPVLAMAYLAVVLLARVVEVLSGGPSISRAPILSVVLLVSLPVVDLLLCRIVSAILGGGPDGAAAEGTGARATVEPVLHRAVHVAVTVLGLMAIAGLWQIDLFALAERGLGGRVSSALLGIAITVLLAWTLWELARTAIDRRIAAEGAGGGAEPGEESGRPATRLRTLLPLFRVLLLGSILVMATLSILAALGVNILPLMAGASVIGLAIGFGSQTLVRDIVSGAFFLMDDAFRLGEYIEVGSAKGTVEKITIRSLHLRHHRGAINILPYGEIQQLRNTSRDWIIMTLEFRLTYDTDLVKVKKILKRIGEEIAADPELGPEMLEPLKSQGVMATEDSALLVRAKFMARPGSAPFLIRREAYTRILRAFAAEGIRFAHRQVTVFVPPGETARPQLAAAAAAAAEPPATS
jgi:small-conductance mechanosensitive channel/phosphatidylglycerophosphate synthase